MGDSNDVFGVVLPFAVYFATKDDGDAQIDNFPFRLHYKFTSGFLFMATALLALNNMFGKDIQCIDQSHGKSHQAITQYCWVTGTFTVPGRQDVGAGLAGTSTRDQSNCYVTRIDNNDQEDRDYYCHDESGYAAECARNATLPDIPCRQTHNYYQWVPYMLVLQGALFMLPHKLWKFLEEGKMKCISEGVRKGNNDVNIDREMVSNNIAKFVAKQNKTSGHLKYAVSFMFCQVLSLVNVVFNFFLLDIFFDGKFLDFGQRWISSLSNPNSHSVLTDVFPKMTICEWRQHGTGGHVETRHYLCILATNIATEKVFIFMWFWLIILFLITLIGIIYYGILFFSKDVAWRDRLLAVAINSTKGAKINSEKQKEEEVHMFLKNLPPSKFFFLYLLGHNVDYNSLKMIVQKITEFEKSPPGYRTTVKNRFKSQFSISPERQLSTMSSIRSQQSLLTLGDRSAPPQYSASLPDSDSFEMSFEMKGMKGVQPVVPQPGTN